MRNTADLVSRRPPHPRPVEVRDVHPVVVLRSVAERGQEPALVGNAVAHDLPHARSESRIERHPRENGSRCRHLAEVEALH